MRTPRSTMLTLLAGAAAVAMLATVAGCGKDDAGTQPTQSAPTTIVVTRTGGLAGVNQTIEIDPDGGWVFTDRKANTNEHGTLSAAQRGQLLLLVSAPSFLDELLRTPVAVDCADTFRYTFNLGAQSATFDECDRDNRPSVMAAITAVTDATPF